MDNEVIDNKGQAPRANRQTPAQFKEKVLRDIEALESIPDFKKIRTLAVLDSVFSSVTGKIQSFKQDSYSESIGYRRDENDVLGLYKITKIVDDFSGATVLRKREEIGNVKSLIEYVEKNARYIDRELEAIKRRAARAVAKSQEHSSDDGKGFDR